MTRLLVSCCDGQGGLFLVDPDRGAVKRLLAGDYRGIALAGPRIFVGEVHGPVELDRALSPAGGAGIAPDVDMHGVFFRDGVLYLCTTGWNSVTLLDTASLAPVGEVRLPGTGAERVDRNHISSVWVDDDALFLSVHTWPESAPDRPGAVLALDRRGTRVLRGRSLLNLNQPHSVVRFGRDLFYLASGDGALHRNGEPVGYFRGYPRGLAVDVAHYYIGQSRVRHETEKPQACGVIVVRRQDGKRRFIPVPAEEIFDIAIL